MKITSFLLFSLILIACSDTYVYPVPAVKHHDGGSDEDGGSATLMPFGDGGGSSYDGATSEPQEDGGAAQMPDSAVTADSGVGVADAGMLPPPKLTTCGKCISDADCATNYSCEYHPTSGAKFCFRVYTPTTFSCKTLPGGDYLAGSSAEGSTSGHQISRCDPRTPNGGKNLSCDAWHMATGL